MASRVVVAVVAVVAVVVACVACGAQAQTNSGANIVGTAYCDAATATESSSGVVRELNATSGSVYSQATDAAHYENNAWCAWRLRPAAVTARAQWTALELSFDAFELEANLDFLYVFRGGDNGAATDFQQQNVLHTLTGRRSSSSSSSSSSLLVSRVENGGADDVLLVFVADATIVRAGFALHYRFTACADGCHAHGRCSHTVGDDTDTAAPHCVCDAGYSGATCHAAMCDTSRPPRSATMCGGAGACNGDSGVCDCDAGYFGAHCDELQCAGEANVTIDARVTTSPTSAVVVSSGALGLALPQSLGQRKTCHWRIAVSSQSLAVTDGLTMRLTRVVLGDSLACERAAGHLGVALPNQTSSCRGDELYVEECRAGLGAQGADESCWPVYAAANASPDLTSTADGAGILLHAVAGSEFRITYRSDQTVASSGFSASVWSEDCAHRCEHGRGFCVNNACDCMRGFSGTPDCLHGLCPLNCTSAQHGTCVDNATLSGSTLPPSPPSPPSPVTVVSRVCNCTPPFSGVDCSMCTDLGCPQPTHCKAQQSYGTSSGLILDHDGPGTYLSNQSCVFTIMPTSARDSIKLTFDYISLSIDATLEIFDQGAAGAGQRVYAFSYVDGSVGEPDPFRPALAPLYLSSGQARVEFHTLSPAGFPGFGRGFKMHWQAVSCPDTNGCHRHGTCTDNGCVCHAGWSGDACDVEQCHNDCNAALGLGRCVRGAGEGGGDHCECALGTSGIGCEWSDCLLGLPLHADGTIGVGDAATADEDHYRLTIADANSSTPGAIVVGEHGHGLLATRNWENAPQSSTTYGNQQSCEWTIKHHLADASSSGADDEHAALTFAVKQLSVLPGDFVELIDVNAGNRSYAINGFVAPPPLTLGSHVKVRFTSDELGVSEGFLLSFSDVNACVNRACSPRVQLSPTHAVSTGAGGHCVRHIDAIDGARTAPSITAAPAHSYCVCMPGAMGNDCANPRPAIGLGYDDGNGVAPTRLFGSASYSPAPLYDAHGRAESRWFLFDFELVSEPFSMTVTATLSGASQPAMLLVQANAPPDPWSTPCREAAFATAERAALSSTVHGAAGHHHVTSEQPHDSCHHAGIGSFVTPETRGAKLLESRSFSVTVKRAPVRRHWVAVYLPPLTNVPAAAQPAPPITEKLTIDVTFMCAACIAAHSSSVRACTNGTCTCVGCHAGETCEQRLSAAVCEIVGTETPEPTPPTPPTPAPTEQPTPYYLPTSARIVGGVLLLVLVVVAIIALVWVCRRTGKRTDSGSGGGGDGGGDDDDDINNRDGRSVQHASASTMDEMSSGGGGASTAAATQNAATAGGSTNDDDFVDHSAAPMAPHAVLE